MPWLISYLFLGENLMSAEWAWFDAIIGPFYVSLLDHIL